MPFGEGFFVFWVSTIRFLPYSWVVFTSQLISKSGVLRLCCGYYPPLKTENSPFLMVQVGKKPMVAFFYFIFNLHLFLWHDYLYLCSATNLRRVGECLQKSRLFLCLKYQLPIKKTDAAVPSRVNVPDYLLVGFVADRNGSIRFLLLPHLIHILNATIR